MEWYKAPKPYTQAHVMLISARPLGFAQAISSPRSRTQTRRANCRCGQTVLPTVVISMQYFSHSYTAIAICTAYGVVALETLAPSRPYRSLDSLDPRMKSDGTSLVPEFTDEYFKAQPGACCKSSGPSSLTSLNPNNLRTQTGGFNNWHWAWGVEFWYNMLWLERHSDSEHHIMSFVSRPGNRSTRLLG